MSDDTRPDAESADATPEEPRTAADAAAADPTPDQAAESEPIPDLVEPPGGAAVRVRPAGWRIRRARRAWRRRDGAGCHGT